MSNIEHVFAVMLENRSLDPHGCGVNGTESNNRTQIDGAAATNANRDTAGTDYPDQTRLAPCIMDIDPGHEFPNVAEQLTGVFPVRPLGGGVYPHVKADEPTNRNTI